MEWTKAWSWSRLKKFTLIVIFLVASILRLWQLNRVPVSLFGDELDVGYQAYSILKTGKDYYGNPWPIHFHSLAEWRTPLYLYSSVPTVAIFGISPLGVRLPAAIFGIFGIAGIYLLVKKLTNSEKQALIAAVVLALSPWDIQYSRAGFEVTELLFFLIFGLYFFFESLSQKGKWLWVSGVSLALMPWVYSTAKLFTPILLLFLFLVWRRQIQNFPKKYLVYAIAALFIVATPIAYSTFFGGGTQRFNYISIFSDPTIEPEVGTARQIDARVRGETGTGLAPTIIDKLFHNKFTFWTGHITNNMLKSLSSDFLFFEGDPNPRHSINGMGEFYKVEIVALLLGLGFFFRKDIDKRLKAFISFWIVAGILPSDITRDGGDHSTRLILILPPLVFLISYGLYSINHLFNKTTARGVFVLYGLVFLLCFIFYEHTYWVHNPWNSERWWHAGYGDAIKSVKAIDKNYDRVVISTAGEPPWVFFAAWYEYPPDKWQKNFPIGNDVDLKGFGKVSHIDKFYFGSPAKGGVYDWGQVMDPKTLYLASAKEVNVNLIMEPERTPKDLNLIKAIAYPSGEPAFYLFTGIK